MTLTTRDAGLRLGIINLNAVGMPDTVNLPDPFARLPPHPGVPTGYFHHPDFWPVPVAHAVADWGGGTGLLEGSPAAIEAVAAAVDQLAPLCDLIVGNCGYMYCARSAVRSNTPTLLSGLQLLPCALEASSRPVGILTFDKDYTGKMLADHPDFSRLRIVGSGHLPTWSLFMNPDRYAKSLLDTEALRREIVEACFQERQTGAFTEIGSLVLECTAMPQFRADIVAALRVPTWDIAAFAKALLGA
ncbi:hypothetical protein AS156_16000 [Bradyrhizobium macuxiense]|uniref:Asp/Glu/hydantoin racemase n=1 Tax=Bradyrhizobium macuxiense TaxID=1755647 RepID=A0A109JIF7_9BRAD|nr:hypothetical protein [Bradyrhizobium macuxiense]KWV49473.1 hypothetical protein AS156_16000 [Bradyrhizobium macuxiense]